MIIFKNQLATALIVAGSFVTLAQTGPEITSWIRNTNSATGYNNLPSNVQTVQYSANYVYVSCSCIPGYAIGPWAGNPNVPANQNFVYKIPRTPQVNTGAATAIGLGHSGVFTNGVSIFNVSDAMSYNNAGVWNRNAYYWEGPSFDNCLGHPQQQGEYHHHVSPKCLYDINDNTKHSPIIGWAFDGYPVYGAYGYASTNGTGGVKRMVSSYTLSSNTTRANGPAVNASYPNGCFIEDHIYTAGYGDLDQRNGRFCVTPEYPNGTYAYFVTLDATLLPAFPYTMMGTYYGVVTAGNTGPMGGHVTISEATTVYTGSGVTTGLKQLENSIRYEVMPNPSNDHLFIYMDVNSANNVKAFLYDQQGKLVKQIDFLQPSIAYSMNISDLPYGIYSLVLQNDQEKVTRKVVRQR